MPIEKSLHDTRVGLALPRCENENVNGASEDRAAEHAAGRIIRIIPIQEKPAPANEGFGVDMTREAAEGRIDPVVGRDEQIERMVQVLCRRKKNNPVLIGHAGVGKTAIVEGLALRIVRGQVPRMLRGKQLISLDVASMVAGTLLRGHFEELIKAIIDGAARQVNVILFIDELHTIVGAGATQGGLDVANILKPALARGGLQCIGATTLDEYRESVEKDAALERRFQKVMVEPSTPAQTLEILRRIRPHYEKYHCVRFTDQALEACVALTDRYIPSRYLPDKAIDALDEAGARANSLAEPEPEAMLALEAALIEVEDQRHAAVAAGDYQAAANARIREAALQGRLDERRKAWDEQRAANPKVLTVTVIEQVVTSMTGIPVERISQQDKQRLGGLADSLKARVIGQDAAVEKVARSVVRSRAGLKDPARPIGVFMFTGPTGVGKTHLARELAGLMFDRQDAVVRIDMGEYTEKHNVSRMIGSPPGYVGYGEGGQLTEAVRRQPYSVVLFDEIEKAHPEVLGVMLRLFDEGWITDGSGRKVDFRNTIIIMTSNVGSHRVVQRGRRVGFTVEDGAGVAVPGDYRAALEGAFAPEFLNRIDDIVAFETLSQGDICRIVDLELESVKRRAAALGFKLRVGRAALRRLAELGYDARYGVRSLRRTILEQVEEPLAHLIVTHGDMAGKTVAVGCAHGGISLSVK